LWSKDIRKDRKLNIYNAVIKSSLLYGSETWRLTENNKRQVEATEMDTQRRSSRIYKKITRNVTIRQQIGLEEPIIKEIEQNQLRWYGHVQRMAEGRLPKIALKWMPKQRRARRRQKRSWFFFTLFITQTVHTKCTNIGYKIVPATNFTT
jgi:hypothetical protein